MNKIALIGSSDFLNTTLFDILKDSEFKVDRYDPDSPILADPSVLKAYDIIVVDTNLYKEADEGFFTFLLSIKDFLLAGAENSIHRIFPESSSHIGDNMSPEDIIARINSIIYKNSDIKDRPVRKTPRIVTNIDVEYESHGMYHKSKLINLSANGAFISSLNPLPYGSLLKLTFHLNGKETRIEAVGRVIYNIGYNLDNGLITQPGSTDKRIIAMPGMGVFFEEISEAHRQAIKSFIESNLY